MDLPEGKLQKLYSDSMRDTQLDGLLEHTLADALFTFISKCPSGQWRGTPANLLSELNQNAERNVQFSADWPKTSISLSIKLRALAQGFSTQGVSIKFGKGKQRYIELQTDTFEQDDVQDFGEY